MFEKPKILVSRCLGFDKCRYNGQTISDEVVNSLKEFVHFISVCPEVEIGLGVPREPVRIIKEKENENLIFYQPASKKDFTKEIIEYSEKTLKDLDVDGAILKFRSPTCGPSNVKVYEGFSYFSRNSGTGFFAKKLKEKFNDLTVEDEGRLKNFSIRENFYIAIFTIANFKSIYKAKEMKKLIEFHSKNKYLFMAYNQSKLKVLGKILANHEKNSLEDVFNAYKDNFLSLFNKTTSFKSWINVILHVYGGFKKDLEEREKKFFLNKIEEYRDERVPLSVLISILYSFAIRFNKEYILNQTILNPYPKELLEITDSGKGRKI
jgi:uncharacterized protein YbgA (DUF1722 family)/uncharacterized protein YbbK (DUF523 family)